MSRGPVSSSTFAFCASLVVHAAILYALVTRYLHDVDHIYLAGFVRDDVSWSSIALEPVTPPPSETGDTALGEQTGHGDSINPADGERPHEAPRAEQSQLFLSRDPEGFGKVGDPVSMSVLPEGASAKRAEDDAASPPRRAAFGVTTPQEQEVLPRQMMSKPVEVARKPVDDTSRTSDTTKADSSSLNPLDTDAKAQATDAAAPASNDAPTPVRNRETAPAPAPAPAPVVASAANSLAISRPSPQDSRSNNTDTQPGAPAPSADPAPMADSESDPFSKTGSVRFVAGRADVQFGRKHRLVRPQLELAGKAALLELPSPITVVLRLHLDSAGNVVRADIAKSSGSPDVDQPVKVAAYQWWLEPSRDHDGHAIADVVPFVVRFN